MAISIGVDAISHTRPIHFQPSILRIDLSHSFSKRLFLVIGYWPFSLTSIFSHSFSNHSQPFILKIKLQPFIVKNSFPAIHSWTIIFSHTLLSNNHLQPFALSNSLPFFILDNSCLAIFRYFPSCLPSYSICKVAYNVKKGTFFKWHIMHNGGI